MHQVLKKLRARLEKSVVVGELLWREILKCATVLELKKNQRVVMQGTRNKYCFFVGFGSLKTSIITESGDRITVWFHFDDLFEFGTTLDSYFLDVPTKYEIIALEQSTVVRFPKVAADALLPKYPAFNSFYISDIVKDFVVVNEFRSLQLALTPLEFLNYIKMNYGVMLERTSSKNMAQFMGISPEWYSKLKKRMTNQANDSES